MKQFGTGSLFGFGLCLVLGVVASPSRAQDDSNEAIAAAKKASTIIEMTGFAQVKPTQFYLQVELEAEGKGQSAARTSLQSLVERSKSSLIDRNFQIKNEMGTRILFHPKDNPSVWAQVQGTMPASFSPDESIKVISGYGVLVNSPQKAQEAFTIVRLTGGQGRVTVYNGLQDNESARQAALKVAIEHANARAKILNSAAAPKQLDLLFVKQGEFEISETETSIDLQSSKPLPLLATVNAKTGVALFYGFKSPTPPATMTRKTPKILPAKTAAPKIPQTATKPSKPSKNVRP